jgi:hypothetical protein
LGLVNEHHENHPKTLFLAGIQNCEKQGETMTAPPQNAIDAYKALIDGIIEHVLPYGSGSRLAKAGILSAAPDDQECNDYIKTLSDQERTFLVKMLKDARHETIHDLLAYLTWWIDSRDVRLTYKGEPMPLYFVGGLHYDYLSRYDGDWNWPQDEHATFHH